MNIGFDAKRLFNNFTGLGNYSRFIVQGLSEYFPDHHYHLFTPRIKPHPESDYFLNQKNIECVSPPSLVKALKSSSVWRTFFLGKESSKRGIELFHGLSNELPHDLNKIKSVVTIHDLIFVHYPQFYGKINAAIYKAKARHAIRKADKIIAISEQTADDIVTIFNVDRSRVEVVYQGCHSIFHQSVSADDLAAVKNKYQLPKEFILNVGTIEPRKNALLILKALHSLGSQSNIHLVLVGRPTDYLLTLKAYAAANKLVDRIVYLHNVTFKDLPALYRLASAFVYPSFYEGFGIPLVESIACGIPVIAATTPCLKEAGGPSSLYVDPNDDLGLGRCIEKVLTDPAFRARMIHDSSIYIQKFSAKQIAHDLMCVYEKVVNRQL